MIIVWPDDCAVIEKFIDAVMVGFNAVITETSGATVNVLVGGHTYDAGYGGLLTVFGQVLNADFELTQPRSHVWIEWDAIATLEVH